MINIKSLFKAEGTQRVKVPASSEHKAYVRTQKKASPRAGTGKLAKFPTSIKKEILEQRSFGMSGSKIKDIVENMIDTMSEKDQSEMERLGLIDEKKKLTVTNQALTNWAASQGVESRKKRTAAVDAEKESHKQTKKELDRADRKISELEVRAKHNLEEIKLVQASKQDSDKIRGDLRRDNVELKEKLRVCLAGKK